MEATEIRIYTETTEDMAFIDAFEPKYKLVKGIIKYELTYNGFDLDVFQQIIHRRTEIMLRLFFLKRFGWPIGCNFSGWFKWNDLHRVTTKDGMRQSYIFRGKKFMDKIIKPTRNGWQVELIYRD